MRVRGSSVWAIVIAAFFAVFLVFPVGHVLAGAFVVDGKFSFEAFTLAFQNPVLVESIQNSFAVSGIVMVACTVLAFPLALLFVNREFRGKGVFQALLLGALVLPPFVASIGFRQLFARFGSVNLALLELGWIDRPIDFLGAHPLAGVIALETLHLFPILFLNLLATLANVDPSLVEAAASSGASRWRVFRKVTFPLVLPGWFAGAIVVFIFALTDLGTPIVFDARNLVAVQIFERASEGSREPVAYALVVLVLVLTLVLFGLGRYAVARHSGAQASKGTVASRTRPLSRGEALWVVPLLILLVVATLLPHLSILLVSISDHWFFSALPQEVTARHYGRLATDPIAYLGVKNSLIYASLSTLVDLVLGVAIAWLSVRKRTKTGFLLDAMAMLPLALPGIVLAFGYANGFTSPMLDGLPAPVRAFFASPTVLLVFGYAVRRLPYVVRAADAGLRQIPTALEEAASNLGASRASVLRTVTVPMLIGNLLAGGLLAFSFAMLEVSESLILAPTKDDYPIAKAIYQLLGDLSDGPQLASAMGVVGMALLLYALLVAGRLLGKSLGELFRA